MRNYEHIKELVIASHNAGKVEEIQALLAPFPLTIHSASHFSLPEPIEDGDSFEANAAIKARSAFKHSQCPSLADDSGLAIPALGGAPGIYSARWAGEKKDFSQAIKRVEQELQQKNITANGADAYFVCVLAVAVSAEHIEYFRGEVHGSLTFPPKGNRGFGYDPVFTAHNYSQTFSEIAIEEKQRISHRAKAFEQFVDWMEQECSIAATN